MSRTTRYIIYYVLIMVILGVVAFFVVGLLRPYREYQLLLVLLLLIPGRLHSYFWKDFYIGKRLVRSRDYEGSIRHTRLFLRTLEERPWIRFFGLSNWFVYTWNARAMAFNNLGAAHLASGQLDAADASFAEALDLDPLYPVPHSNLAVLHYAQGNDEQGDVHRQKAIDLGIRRGKVDQLCATVRNNRASSATQTSPTPHT